MKRPLIIFCLFIFPLFGSGSTQKYQLERIYVLNNSDYRFSEFRKDIAFSKRYRGNYYKVFPFRKLRFAEYYLKKGETIYTVATRLGLSVDSIASASGIVFLYAVKPYQRLIVPNSEGVLYKTEQGCRLSWLASRYNVKRVDIMRFNGYYKRYLTKGDWLYIPGAHMPALEQALFYGTAFANPLPTGRLSSKFGFRRDPLSGRHAFHGGIDIAAPYNTPVKAAHQGVVEFVGWSGGYGKLIVVKHAFGYRTFYGHLAKISVRRGMQVDIGKIIGRVGSTGYSTGPHLHFEIRHYKRKLNPSRYSSLNHRTKQVIF